MLFWSLTTETITIYYSLYHKYIWLSSSFHYSEQHTLLVNVVVREMYSTFFKYGMVIGEEKHLGKIV